jgi:two-component system response regulator YesN
MYKVLIADDEKMIRRGIAKLLEADIEVAVVCQAEDGEMALDMAAKHQPELLLVDINMPFMNGLEFIEAVKTTLPDAVILVITGYDDFAYAQKALKLGVFDYLLKPVMEEPFYQCVGRAKERLRQNMQQKRYLHWAQKQVERSRPTLLATFFEGWLAGQFTEPEIRQQMDYLRIDIPRPFGVALAHLSPDDSDLFAADRWNEDLLYYAAENIAGEVFEPLAPVTCCKSRGGDLVLLCAVAEAPAFQASGRRLGELLREHLPLAPLIVQEACATYEDMPEVYQALADQISAHEKHSPAVQAAKACIDAKFGDPELSLQTAADEAFVSPQHLSRLFRHEMGLTFTEYLTQARIRKATELLQNKDLKMYEVAERAGYASQHYFSSAFKRVLGVSPAEYRKSASS